MLKCPHLQLRVHLHYENEGHNTMARNRLEHPARIGLREAGERCDVDPRTIRRWISEGRLTAYRVGPRLIKIDVAELDKLVRPVGGAA